MHVLEKKKSKISDLNIHLKKIGKEQQIKPKVNRKRKLWKVEINEIESKCTIGNINKAKVCSLKKSVRCADLY